MRKDLQQEKEEILEEFDQRQRLFLTGKYHSTWFNKWFEEVYDRIEAETEERLWMENLIEVKRPWGTIKVCAFCSNQGYIANPEVERKPCICPNGQRLLSKKEPQQEE